MNDEANVIAKYFANGDKLFMNFRNRHNLTCEEAGRIIDNKKRDLQGLDPLD